MKNLLTKSIILVFIVSLLFSFAACGKEKDDMTTGMPTTTEESTTKFITEQVALSEPLPVELIETILSNAGDKSWDGEVASLTDKQKDTILDYFADTAPGETVEFIDGNIYLVRSSDEATTNPDAEDTLEKPSGDAVNIKKPQPNKPQPSEPQPSNPQPSNPQPSNPNNEQANAALKTESGAVLSYLYDEDEQFFYVEDNPWQRQFGFNDVYDGAANFAVMYYDTVRVKFNYAGKDWMIQMWMGQYGLVFVGSEIGVYTKEPSRKTNHYDCASDEDSLKMEMSLYNHGKWLFTRNYDTYWWITGFVPGSLDYFSDRSQLTMLSKITLKDTQMRDLFVNGLQANGFKSGYNGLSTANTYKIQDETTVSFNWKGEDKKDELFEVNFYPEGGKGDTKSLLMKKGEEITEDMIPEVTKEGYTFAGWAKGRRTGSIAKFPQTVGSSSLTTKYYATWEKNSYTVTFDKNAGEGSYEAVKEAYNTSIELPRSGFTKGGHTFIGWNTTPAAETILSTYKVPAQDTTLYAVYTVD